MKKQLNKKDLKKSSGGKDPYEKSTATSAVIFLAAAYLTINDPDKKLSIANSIRKMGMVDEFNAMLKQFGADNKLLLK